MSLTSGQVKFVNTLSGLTGLDPHVIAAWTTAEESGGAAQAREKEDNHNWLNIGYFDSGPGAITKNQAFGNPEAAAKQTAKFLKGEWGGASTGIRNILNSIKTGPEGQIAAIAGSGWASSGYEKGNSLRSLYSQYKGQTFSGASRGVGGEKNIIPGLPGEEIKSAGPVQSTAPSVMDVLSGLNEGLMATGGNSEGAQLRQQTYELMAQMFDKNNPLSTPPRGGSEEAHRSKVNEAISGAPSSSGYVDPLGKSFTMGRTDQGVDFSATPGAPIRAVGNAKILGIEPNWFEGQPFVYYRLLDGPQKGKVVYVAEQITPSVRAGQVVRAGQEIGRYAQNGTGIETGFGTPSGVTLARATTGYNEGEVTPAGQQFLNFLKSLGVK